jgi:hypothetical protein
LEQQILSISSFPSSFWRQYKAAFGSLYDHKNRLFSFLVCQNNPKQYFRSEFELINLFIANGIE